MATQPKPKPKPEPEPKPDDDDAAHGEPWKPGDNLDPPTEPGIVVGFNFTFDARMTALEKRMDAIEERQNAPPIGLGRRP